MLTAAQSDEIVLMFNLESAARRLRSTPETSRFPDTLGYEIVRCSLQIKASAYLLDLVAKRPEFIATGHALVARANAYFAGVTA